MDELVESLTKHFQPPSTVISERYSFHCRCQEPSESIADFVVSLKKLIIRCDYDAAIQKTLLRDRFVCGLTHESTRKRLLTEDNSITFDRAVEIATSVEKASVQAKQMKAGDTKPTVNQVRGKPHNSNPIRSNHSQPVCYRCGGPHLAHVCRFIRETCRSCGKTGHISKVCRSKRIEHSHTAGGAKTSSNNSRNRTNVLELTDSPTKDSLSTESSYTMFNVVSGSKPIIFPVMINNTLVNQP